MRTSIALILVLSTTLTACGGGDPKAAAFEALQSGNYGAAVTSFDAALAAVDKTSPDYVGLAVSRCEALAHTDAEAAKTAMMSLAADAGSKVTAKDYNMVAQSLINAREYKTAIFLLDDGIKNRFKGDAKLTQLMDKIVIEAEKSGDDGAMDALQGLGYAGE